MSSNPEQHQSHHPTFKQYVLVATILFAITIVEVLIIVPNSLRGSGVAIAPLVILSGIKFVIVIMFYMHLKFEAKLFSVIFVGGLLLALSVGFAVISLFGSFQPKPRAFAQEHAVAYVAHEAGAAEVEQPTRPEVVPPPASEQTTPPEPPPSPADTGSAGDAEQGLAVFTGIGGCAGCHTIDGTSAGLVGPDLTHIGTDAATRNGPQSAEQYITEAIRDPQAFVAQGVERAIPGIMTKQTTSGLSDSDVEALVAFLLEQK